MIRTFQWFEYVNIWDKALAFKAANGRMPNYIDYNGFRIYMAALKSAYDNVVRFKQTYGRTPNTVDISVINIPAPSPEKQSFTNWYNGMIGIGYAHYSGDKYTPEEEAYNLAHHIAMNCSDYSQTAMRVAKALGYEARYIHVICQSGEGHIYIQVKGHEFSDWTNADVAAAASVGSKYSLGNVWCSNPRSKWVSTEPWLVNNDGIT